VLWETVSCFATLLILSVAASDDGVVIMVVALSFSL
jgi:hypothetical protein